MAWKRRAFSTAIVLLCTSVMLGAPPVKKLNPSQTQQVAIKPALVDEKPVSDDGPQIANPQAAALHAYPIGKLEGKETMSASKKAERDRQRLIAMKQAEHLGNRALRKTSGIKSARQGGDTCGTAVDISGPLPISVTGTTTGYTNDYDEVCPYTGSTAPDVVYSYTPTANIAVNLTLCTGNTDYDTKMYVYETTCPDTGNPVGCNDDACTSAAGQDYVSEILGLSLTAGTTYYIVIDGYGANDGTYFLDITECPPPADECPEGTLYSQTRDLADGNWTAGTSDSDAGYIRYESFSGVAGPICDVHWWGMDLAYDPYLGFYECDEDPMTFEIKFYPDAGGVPGAETCSYTVVPTRTFVESYSSYDVWYYSVDLPSCCTLTDGWISIQGVGGDTTCWFLWLSAAPCGNGDGSNCLDDGTSVVCGPPDNDFDLSICLTGAAEPGACCNDDTGVCDDNVDVTSCGPGNRFVSGVLCADLVPQCGAVTGACCFDDGTCSEVFEADCVAGGGVYQGDFTDCDPNPCVGACCFDDGSCGIMSDSQCVNSNGTYQGDETTCDPNPCPQPAPDCPPDALYSAPMDIDNWIAGTSDAGAGYIRYDSFDAGGEICDLHFWGMNLLYDYYYGWTNCTQDPMDFEIKFYTDANGQLGTETCSYTVSAPGPVVWTVYDYYGNPYYIHEYNVDFATCCVMPTGGWVSVQGVSGTSCWFLWMASTIGDGSSCIDDGTGLVCGPPDNDYDLGMCVTGNTGDFYGSCCDDTTGICNDNVLAANCADPLRWTYDTMCADLDPQCGHLTGACCDPVTGDCRELEEDQCVNSNGLYQGDWTTCDPNPCPQPGDDCSNPLDIELPHDLQEICGDFTNDGVVDADDYWFMVDSMVTCVGDIKYQPACDMDGDECITLADYQLWLLCYDEFGKGGNRAYVDTNYTCGRGNAYSDTCLGYYDGGEDIIYEVTVTAPVDVDITLDPQGTTYTGLLLDDSCPPDNDCIRTTTESGSDIHSTGCVHLEPGTYYIMVDTWPSPDCIPQFELTIESCVPQIGRCCYDAQPVQCVDVLEGECQTVYGGDWTDGLNCTDDPCPEPILNDDCETAEPILSVPYSTTFDNSQATAGVPSCNTLYTTTQNDAWWTYTPDTDCYMIVDVAEIDSYDMVMGIYTGPDCNNLTNIECLDDPEPYHLEFAATAGTTYWFQIGDYGSTAGGGLTSFTLDCSSGVGACCFQGAGTCQDGMSAVDCTGAGGVYQGDLSECATTTCTGACCILDQLGTCIDQGEDACSSGIYNGLGSECVDVTCPIPPENDVCDDAIDITAVPYSTTFDNSLAFAGPPSCNTSYTETQNDVWYTYTPADDCLMILDVDEFNSYDMVMGIWSGPDCNNLTEVDCLDDPEPYHVEMTLAGGTTYWFQIGDYGSTPGGGNTQFDLDCGAPPTGACCEEGVCTATTTEPACPGDWFEGETCPEFAGCPQPCPEDTLRIEILTDSYPTETTWEVTSNGTLVASGAGSEASTLHTWDVCLSSNGCYDFTIYDSYGDGIFSPGGYDLYLNDVLVATNHSFAGSSETVAVGSACVPPTGACCSNGVCVATTTETECPGDWFEGEECPAFECPTYCLDSIYFNGSYDGVNALHNGRFDDNSHAWRIVDDVTFLTDVIVEDLHWWGNEPVGFNWSGQTADYIILADNAGAPGAVVASADAVAATRVDTGATMFGDPVWFYQIDGLNIPLSAGTYWFGMRPVQNQPYGTGQYDHGWWATAPNNGTSIYYVDDDPPSGYVIGADYEAVAFCVTGQEVGAEPSGACCDDTTGICNDGVLAGDCTGRFAADTMCVDLDPVCGAGACCFDDGMCQVLTADACSNAFGEFQGGGTDCDPNPCPQPQPANDDCIDAEPIGDVTTLGFDTTYATSDGLGTHDICQNIWYCYTAPCDGDVYVSLCDSSYDTKLAVYEGCTCDPLGTEMGYNDDGCSAKSFADRPMRRLIAQSDKPDKGRALQSDLHFTAVAGQTYLIEVGGYYSSYSGTCAAGVGTLSVTCSGTGACCRDYNASCDDDVAEVDCAGANDTYYPGQACVDVTCPEPPPANDPCDFATDITAVPFSDLGVNIPNATDDSNVDPSCDSSYSCSNGPANNGVWYTYTPTQDCTATIDQTGIDAATSIWTGSDCNNLTEAECSDPDPFGYEMTAGTQYWILVSNWSCSSEPSSAIDFDFDCQPPAPCVPDVVADFSVDPLPYVNSNSNCGLGDDYDTGTCLDPNYDNGEDIIYELYFPDDVCVNITLDGDTSYSGIAIGTECPPASGCLASSMSSSADESIEGLNLTAGTYYLMIDTWSAPDCIANYTLTIEECPSTGACCRNYDASCDDDVAEGDCNGANDTWFGGQACVDVTCPPSPPANDLCGSATAITAVPFSDTSVNIPLATDDANVDPSCDSSYSCSNGPANNGVWYTYTPDVTCTATIDQTGIDAATSVWSGADCNSLTQLTCSDPDPFDVELTGGTQYWILVSNWSCSSEPSSLIDFDLDCVPPPTGACCEAGVCTGTTIESECAGDWYEGQDCMSFTCPGGCDHTIDMNDSYGDGWNGAAVHVFVNGTEAAGSPFTVSSGYNNSATFLADTGDTITTTWDSGSFDSECSYDIYDGTGALLCGESAPPVGGLNCTGNCPAALQLPGRPAPGPIAPGTRPLRPVRDQ